VNHTFEAYGPAHLTVIFLTIASPFLLAALVRRTKSRKLERSIVIALSSLLVLNYVTYMLLVGRFGAVSWQQVLPLQLCDWEWSW